MPTHEEQPIKVYELGKIYHIFNERFSVNWIGPFEEFVRDFAKANPNAGAISRHRETVVRGRPVKCSVATLASDPTDAHAVSALTEWIKRRKPVDDLNDLEVRAIAPDVLLRAGAFIGDVRVIQRALEMGALIDGTGPIGMAPIHWAATCNHAEAFQFLVDRNARTDTTNQCTCDLLDLAATNHAGATCRLLLKLGFSKPGVAFSKMLERSGIFGDK